MDGKRSSKTPKVRRREQGFDSSIDAFVPEFKRAKYAEDVAELTRAIQARGKIGGRLIVPEEQESGSKKLPGQTIAGIFNAARTFNESHGKTLAELGLNEHLLREKFANAKWGDALEAIVRMVQSHQLENNAPMPRKLLLGQMKQTNIIPAVGNGIGQRVLSRRLQQLANSKLLFVPTKGHVAVSPGVFAPKKTIVGKISDFFDRIAYTVDKQ